MRLFVACCLVLPVALAATTLGRAADDASERSQMFGDFVAPLLTEYCSACHGQDSPEADLNLEDASRLSAVQDQRKVWESILEMMRLDAMPPEDEPRPEQHELARLIAWIEASLADVDCSKMGYPGRVTVRRLNRAEYNNTIRDLVGIDFRPANDFPSDDVGAGFDNIGDVLSLPPMLLEKYLAAAEQVIDKALNDPAARARLLFCQPGPDATLEQCRRTILKAFANRAWRRPIADSELNALITLSATAEQLGSEGTEPLEAALQAILISPRFLFRIEKDPTADDPGRVRVLDSYEVASRLSYFLWSSMPDEPLFDLASRSILQDEAVLAEQVKRMLSDPKAEALVENFAGQWLALRSLDDAAPDPQLFPDFDESLRSAMLEETQAFFRSLVQEDRSVMDLLHADYTFVNERLAKHYGIPNVTGSEFRRVTAPDQRGGIVAHASILTLTSNPTRTSPVKRGKWVLDNILGTPPPPPPPNIPELGEGELLGTLRERMEQHRADPTCASCHERMDALGFGLENFDAVGAWRDRDGDLPIDPSGTLPDGASFDEPRELMETLKTERSELFCRCLVEKMLTYALGRGLEPYDRCAVQEIVEQLAADEYRFSALATAIVTSDPFRMRGSEGVNE